MKFYLGAHHPNWLRFSEVPLFVSRRRLTVYKKLPRAASSWALDSGGFTELTMFGGWTLSEEEYVADVERFAADVGPIDFVAPQDWMCEKQILAKTGLTVVDHQHRTVENFCRLRQMAPHLPFIPVLQGWTFEDYIACVQMYEAAGVHLKNESTVGIGSVCRRQHTVETEQIVTTLANDFQLRLHGFGVKVTGLVNYAPYLQSADSMAWSYHARRIPALPTCTHKNCANCFAYALLWRNKITSMLNERMSQTTMQF